MSLWQFKKNLFVSLTHLCGYTTTFQRPEFLVKNSLSAPTQVFQECGPEPRFGQDLVLWIWVGLEYPPPFRTYLGAGVWRLITISPKDTVSFVLFTPLPKGFARLCFIQSNTSTLICCCSIQCQTLLVEKIRNIQMVHCGLHGLHFFSQGSQQSRQTIAYSSLTKRKT